MRIKYYVSMTSKLLGGFELSNRIRKLVFECDSELEAETVIDNAKHKEGVSLIKLCCNKPKFNPEEYYTTYENKESCPNWYKKGYFNTI